MPISNYTLILNNILNNRAKDYREPQMKTLLEDLQANVLKSHGKKYAIHACLHFYNKKEKEVKQWLRKLELTSAWQQLDVRYGDSVAPKNLVSLYFTHEAYQYLNYDANKLPEFGATPFSGTPQSRLALHINLKEEKFPTTNKIHAMIMIAGDDKKKLKKQLEAIAGDDIKTFNSNKRETPVRGRIGHAFVQWGERKKVGPFGFVDKASNPLFFPGPNKEIPEEEIAQLDSILIKDPNGAKWNSCGSFLVFLKLKQNVQAFTKDLENIKTATGYNTDMAKAFIVGKFPHKKGNDDLYLSKMKNCPMHTSHIASAKAKYDKIHNVPMARRGINYKDSKDNQGLLFMSFQSNISTQFEVLVNQFFTNRKDLQVDPLLYNHSLKPALAFDYPKTEEKKEKEKEKNAKIQLEKPFVTLQRGWYFFAPSISSIKKL